MFGYTCIYMSNNDVSELATCCSHLNSEFLCLLVKEKTAWLFLSRKESLRKRNTEHFLEAAQCLPNGIIQHNITGKIRLSSLLFCQVRLRPLFTEDRMHLT